MTKMRSYEEFAYRSFGSKFKTVVSVCNMCSLLGFATAYVALAKTLIPTALVAMVGEDDLPYFL